MTKLYGDMSKDMPPGSIPDMSSMPDMSNMPEPEPQNPTIDEID